jgi:endonuclease/exonuclease/phosphatase family metal-dependent hydrolase
MKRLTTLLLMVALLACQEEITPIIRSTNPGNGNGTPLPSQPVDGKYMNCLSILSPETLDVATWNIENFPLNGSTTLTLLAEMITKMDADIIAVQEINSVTNFNLLMDNLQDYEGIVVGSGQQRLGYIYKPAEIVAFQTPTQLFTDDACAFPRPALKTTITHATGKEVTFINVHLKCCDDAPTQSCLGGIERRRQASVKLKSYIDQNLNDKSVVVLGDWNDDLTQPEGNDVFTNFINDGANFKFADMPIATGSKSNFSYQGNVYTSHLDHLLITNELFTHLDEVRTILFNKCEPQYKTSVSDHFPVIMRLKNLN